MCVSMVTLGSLASLCHMEINLAQALLIAGINNHPYTIPAGHHRNVLPNGARVIKHNPAITCSLSPPLLTLKLNTFTSQVWRGQISAAFSSLGSSFYQVPVTNLGPILSWSPSDCYLKAKPKELIYLDFSAP